MCVCRCVLDTFRVCLDPSGMRLKCVLSAFSDPFLDPSRPRPLQNASKTALFCENVPVFGTTRLQTQPKTHFYRNPDVLQTHSKRTSNASQMNPRGSQTHPKPTENAISQMPPNASQPHLKRMFRKRQHVQVQNTRPSLVAAMVPSLSVRQSAIISVSLSGFPKAWLCWTISSAWLSAAKRPWRLDGNT